MHRILTRGGVFNAPEPAATTDPEGDGSITADVAHRSLLRLEVDEGLVPFLLSDANVADTSSCWIDFEDNHTSKTVRIGKIRADGQFDVVWSSHLLAVFVQHQSTHLQILRGLAHGACAQKPGLEAFTHEGNGTEKTGDHGGPVERHLAPGQHVAHEGGAHHQNVNHYRYQELLFSLHLL